MKRESGFYWVKQTPASEWTIAHHDAESNGWSFDRDDMVSDDHFSLIEERRIKTPDEQVKKPVGPGIELITEERQKQIDKHGFTGEHHANHPEWYDNYQLQFAATTLMMHEFEEQLELDALLPDGWDQEWFDDLNRRDRKERLVIAGALIASEIDRLMCGGAEARKEN